MADVAINLSNTEAKAANEARRQYLLGHYRPELRRDAKGHPTQLDWSGDGKFLEKVVDVLGHETSFDYDSQDRLLASIDAQERQTVYVYGDSNNPRQATEIRVYEISAQNNLLQLQTFSYDNKGRVLSEKQIDPTDEVTVLNETSRSYYTSGYGLGLLQSVTRHDMGGADDVTSTYFYDSYGRVVQVNQSSNFGGCTILHCL
jgi:YD repeat-containing protein